MARKPGSAEYNQKQRFRAIEIVFKERRTQSDAAKELGVHLRTIQHWVELYRKHDIVGLLSGKATGRPRRLSDKQLKVINKILLKGPRLQGYANDLWTSRIIMELIDSE